MYLGERKERENEGKGERRKGDMEEEEGGK